MAIGATVVEQRSVTVRCCPPKCMPRMALKTEKRHRRVQEIVVDRTVRGVTVGAVFSDVGMLEGEGPLLVHMTAGTELLDRIPQQQVRLNGAMGVMTVGAGHLLLPERMMGKQTVLRLCFRMAPIAHFRHLLATDLLLRPLVELVTVKAADIVKGMYAGIPKGEAGGGCC